MISISEIFSTSNRSRHCSTNSGFESSISVDSAIDIQTPPPQSSNAQTNAKANDDTIANKDTFFEEKRFDSKVEIENDRLSFKDEPNKEEDDPNDYFPHTMQEEPKSPVLNPCRLVEDSDDKSYSSTGNDPLMVSKFITQDL